MFTPLFEPDNINYWASSFKRLSRLIQEVEPAHSRGWADTFKGIVINRLIQTIPFCCFSVFLYIILTNLYNSQTQKSKKQKKRGFFNFLFFVGADGFEPPKSKDSRFTVCPIWPLWKTPNNIKKILISLFAMQK